jgi:hypothetical protein
MEDGKEVCCGMTWMVILTYYGLCACCKPAFTRVELFPVTWMGQGYDLNFFCAFYVGS